MKSYHLNQICKLWPSLTPFQRRRLHYTALWFRYRLPRPVWFALKTTILTFSLLAILPHHPISIPAAFGGALSVTLFFHV